MAKIIFERPSGEELHVEAEIGRSLMDAALSAGVIEIEGQCGGFLNCATCHVYVDEAWRDRVPAPSEEEEELLEGTVEPRGPTSRLSCQINISAELDGLKLKLPSRQS